MACTPPGDALHARLGRRLQRVWTQTKTAAFMIVAFALGLMLRPIVLQNDCSGPHSFTAKSKSLPEYNSCLLWRNLSVAENQADSWFPRSDHPGSFRLGSGAGASLASTTLSLPLALTAVSVGLLTYITWRKMMSVQLTESSVTLTTTTV